MRRIDARTSRSKIRMRFSTILASDSLNPRSTLRCSLTQETEAMVVTTVSNDKREALFIKRMHMVTSGYNTVGTGRASTDLGPEKKRGGHTATSETSVPKKTSSMRESKREPGTRSIARIGERRDPARPLLLVKTNRGDRDPRRRTRGKRKKS